ncbi:MAG: hypothetical protein WC359_13670 [Dehalococcoidia bacterium]|jgi:hypothetical protein
MSGQVKQLWLDRENVAYRPAQVYTSVTGAYNIFTITGPVMIYLLGGRATAAAGGATTLATTINGVAGEAAAVAINGAVGTVFAIPLNVAGVIAGAAGALPLTTALLHPPQGMLAGIGAAGNGVIIFTFAVSTWTGDIFCVYRKLSPSSSVNVA